MLLSSPFFFVLNHTLPLLNIRTSYYPPHTYFCFSIPESLVQNLIHSNLFSIILRYVIPVFLFATHEEDSLFIVFLNSLQSPKSYFPHTLPLVVYPVHGSVYIAVTVAV
jgi:hypothetical protein